MSSIIACSLTFRCLNATVIGLHFEIAATDEGEGENWFETFPATIFREVFSQASRTTQDLLLLDDVNHLRIYRDGPIPHSVQIASEVERLFRSVGPSVEELHCKKNRALNSVGVSVTKRLDISRLVTEIERACLKIKHTGLP